MKNNKTNCKMRMITFPSIGLPFLAAAFAANSKNRVDTIEKGVVENTMDRMNA